MITEPKIHTVTKTLGTCEVKFEGEQYIGHSVLDTRVTINGVDLCWISWKDVDAFTTELQATIQKYYI